MKNVGHFVVKFPAVQRVRRGKRIALCLPVMLHWREPLGCWREIPAQTKMLSRHGCLLRCAARIKLSDEVAVWWLEKAHDAQARVVFRTLNRDGSVEIALEFLDTDNYWALDFGPGYATTT